MPHTTPEPRHVSHLERKNFFVNSEEEGHCLGPRCQPSHITTNFLGIFHGVVFHLQVGHQQLDRFFVNGILSEEMVIELENATETRLTLGKTSFYCQKWLERPLAKIKENRYFAILASVPSPSRPRVNSPFGFASWATGLIVK